MERGKIFIKKLDRYLSFLIFIISIFRRKKTFFDNYKSVAIFSFAAIGDSILSSCIMNAIKNNDENILIKVYCSKSNYAVFSVLPNIDQLTVLPVLNPFKVLLELCRHDADILIDTSQWPRISALYAIFFRARFKIGFKTTGQYRHYCYDISVNHSPAHHEIINFINLIKPIKITGNSKLVPRRFDDEYIVPYSNYIIFHPWASGEKYEQREWPIDYWHILIRYFIKEGFIILISGSISDKYRVIKNFSEIINDKNVINIAGKYNFVDFFRIIQKCQCLISVNTGIMHLGSLADCNVIALNGPTNFIRWGVYSKNGTNISVSSESGGGFLNLGFEYPNNFTYIMDKITPDMVISEFLKKYE
jgi:ADP-heptose:LPS heptosyltransferase